MASRPEQVTHQGHPGVESRHFVSRRGARTEERRKKSNPAAVCPPPAVRQAGDRAGAARLAREDAERALRLHAEGRLQPLLACHVVTAAVQELLCATHAKRTRTRSFLGR